LVFRINRHKKNKVSNAIAEKKIVNNRIGPSREANTDPSSRMEMCPKLKKKMMKPVEMRMALGRLLINRKLIAIRIRANDIEKSNGRMTMETSTSRKFQVSSARLG